ncbi:Ger(x)C family spore germination protein [Bacillus tianshenii]|nr:Ger(x)C family spore germination protein [Bacillus tianshenii]
MWKRFLVIYFSVVLILTGCATSKIVDDVMLVRIITYDLIEDNKLLMKISVPIFKNPQSTDVELFEAKTGMSKIGKKLMNFEAPSPVVGGQVAVALYGEALARRGIYDLVDTLHRDASIGNRIKLAVTKGSATELLSKSLDSVGQRPGMYIENLILQNEKKESLPETNLHLFMKYYYSVGRDPYLPIIDKESGHAKITGIALFKKDKLVKEVLLKDLFILRMLIGEKYKSGSFEVSLEDKEEQSIEYEESVVLIENIRSKTKTKVTIKSNEPTIKLNVQLLGTVTELKDGGNLKNAQTIRKIERLAERRIEQRAHSLINELKESHVDPAGFGNHVKNHWREWDEKKWEEIYPKLKVDVQANVKIVSSGIIE